MLIFRIRDKYPQLEAVEEYAAKETWIPGLHTLNAPLACEYSSATELRNSDQLGLKYADSLKALLDLETKYTTSKDDLSKLNAVDYSSEIGGGLAIERVAVVQQGNWIGPELSGIDEEVANKMGILPIPLKGVKEDCIPTGISIYWCINSQSGDKEKEASKEFLKWLFQSDEGKQIVVNDFGFVPAFNNYDDVEITDTLSKEVKRYIDEVIKLRSEGMTYPNIHKIITEKGYKGSVASLRMFIQKERIRNEAHLSQQETCSDYQSKEYIQRRSLIQLIYKGLSDVKTITKTQYEQVLKTYPVITELYAAIKEFYEILYSRRDERLETWLEKIENFNIPELQTYVNGIRIDINAVKNGIKLKYNNGLAEGSVNKIKVIKRIMYGRNSFDLLKVKVLLHEHFRCEFN